MKNTKRNDRSFLARRGRRARVLVLSSCVALALSVAGIASAQWRVVDNEANQKLNDANSHLERISRRIGEASANGEGTGTVTGNLGELYRQQYLGEFDADNENIQASENPKDDDLVPAGFPSSNSSGIELADRCPPPRAGAAGAAQRQWELCRDIVNTELAQYRYSLAMFELSRKRQSYLDELRSQRASINQHEIGKLQDNTNRILILMSQMEIDKQQHRTYMDAYAARINYLKQATTMLGRQVLDGNRAATSGGLPGAIGGIFAGAMLKGILEAHQSNRRRDFERDYRD